jgi:small subunit ribosomal protein S16
MLAIRLRRTGSSKRPLFRLVVTEARTARDSRSVEVLGHYNPRSKPETLVIDYARLAHWVKAGARPSDSVRTLVARHPAPPPAAEAPTATATPAGAPEPAAAPAPAAEAAAASESSAS